MNELGKKDNIFEDVFGNISNYEHIGGLINKFIENVYYGKGLHVFQVFHSIVSYTFWSTLVLIQDTTHDLAKRPRSDVLIQDKRSLKWLWRQRELWIFRCIPDFRN